MVETDTTRTVRKLYVIAQFYGSCIHSSLQLAGMHVALMDGNCIYDRMPIHTRRYPPMRSWRDMYN